ncbi:hypothetical protein B7494_g3194 [Chlorociboria aeruginascens]|nr:hypothetical protein B7494_g3194 [Chlorociboria aeruginascens]
MATCLNATTDDETSAKNAVAYLLGGVLVIPSLAVSIKTQGSSALPARTGGVSVHRSASRPQWYQVAGLSIFNVCLGVAIQGGVEALLIEVFNIRSALKVTTTLPMPWSIAKDVVRGLVLREVLQYYIHRFVLHPNSPNFVSKLHNSYFHSITSPYSFCAHYDHPVSYVLFRLLPTYLPSVIFRTHLLTYLLLLSIISLEETLALSGYTTIPGIILGGITKRQELHSEGRGKGNFAPWGLLDWIHGTSIGPDVVDDIRDEADKHQVKERSSKAMGDAKETGKEGFKTWQKDDITYRRNRRPLFRKFYDFMDLVSCEVIISSCGIYTVSILNDLVALIQPVVITQFLCRCLCGRTFFVLIELPTPYPPTQNKFLTMSDIHLEMSLQTPTLQ